MHHLSVELVFVQELLIEVAYKWPLEMCTVLVWDLLLSALDKL